MSKQTTALIILALLLIGGFGLWWFFGRTNPSTQTTDSPLPTTLLPITANPPSPTGSNPDTPINSSQTPSSDISSIANQYGLSRLVLGPIASVVVLPSASNTIAYIEKTTGNLYSLNLAAGTPIRLTNTTIPATQEAFWGLDKKGWHIMIRDLKDNAAENILGNLSLASSTGGVSSLDTVDLSDAIYNVTINPTRNTWFYLTNQNGSTVGMTADLNNKNQKTIFRSPFTEWLAMWPSANTIFLQTKTANGIAGFLYQLNQTSGQLTKIIGNSPGLTTTISPDGQKIIYTESAPGNLTSSIKTIKDGSVKELPIKVVPDKCVWSKDAFTIFCAVPTNLSANQNFPDAWYQGTLSFNDSLWKIDTKTLTPTNLYTPARQQNDITFDATKLIMGPNENTLLFINKNDGSLWSFNLRDLF